MTELKTLLSFLEPGIFGAAGERLDELEVGLCQTLAAADATSLPRCTPAAPIVQYLTGCCSQLATHVTAMSLSNGERHHCQEDISEEALTARMRRLLEPFLLRRLKEQVASQLVPKQQEVRAIFFTCLCTVTSNRRTT